MKILELVNSLEIGGAEKMVVDLSQALAAEGHTVTVACLRRAGPLARHLEQSRIEVLELCKPEGFRLETARKLASHLKVRAIEVVHTHNPLVHHYGVFSARLARVPVTVTTVHGPANIQARTPSTLLFELSCLWSDRVVSCCGTVEQHLKNATMIAGRRSVVIRNGIPLDAFDRTACKEPNSVFTFGAVGRLVPVKDHLTLLEAFARVRKSQPHCRLEILGDGPLRGELESRVQALRMADSVRLLGDGLQVPAFLSDIDAFVLSSVSEGLPLTVLEAMGAGRPIVATAVGAIPELLEAAQCGWLAKPQDPEELAAALLAAAAAPDLRARGERGRAYVRRAYSVAGMAAEYEALFLRLLDRRAAGALESSARMTHAKD